MHYIISFSFDNTHIQKASFEPEKYMYVLYIQNLNFSHLFANQRFSADATNLNF